MKTMITNKKKFLTGLLFISILFALNTVFTFLFKKHIASAHSLTQKTIQTFHELNQANGNIDILVLGDSHTDTGINPGYFNCKVAKWCFGGERYPYNYFKLQHFLSHYPPPKFIILPLALHSFKKVSTAGLGGSNDFFWVNYMDYIDFGRKTALPFHFLIKYIKGKYAPYIDESNLFYQWLTRAYPKMWGLFAQEEANNTKSPNPHPKLKPKKNSSNRFVKKPGPLYNPKVLSPAEQKKLESKLAADASSRTKIQFGWRGKYFDPISVDYFKRILKLCSHHGIKVILVKFPVAKIYRKNVQNYFKIQPYYQRIQTIIHHFNQQNPNSIFTLNYLSLFYNYPELLSNSNHVNYNGAIVVSIKLNNFISTLFPSCAPRPVPPPFNTQ